MILYAAACLSSQARSIVAVDCKLQLSMDAIDLSTVGIPSGLALFLDFCGCNSNLTSLFQLASAEQKVHFDRPH